MVKGVKSPSDLAIDYQSIKFEVTLKLTSAWRCTRESNPSDLLIDSQASTPMQTRTPNFKRFPGITISDLMINSHLFFL